MAVSANYMHVTKIFNIQATGISCKRKFSSPENSSHSPKRFQKFGSWTEILNKRFGLPGYFYKNFGLSENFDPTWAEIIAKNFDHGSFFQKNLFRTKFPSYCSQVSQKLFYFGQAETGDCLNTQYYNYV